MCRTTRAGRPLQPPPQICVPEVRPAELPARSAAQRACQRRTLPLDVRAGLGAAVMPVAALRGTGNNRPRALQARDPFVPHLTRDEGVTLSPGGDHSAELGEIGRARLLPSRASPGRDPCGSAEPRPHKIVASSPTLFCPLARRPARGQNIWPAGPSRSASLWSPVRGGRATRSRYSGEHGTTHRRRGLPCTRSWVRGCRGTAPCRGCRGRST